MGTTGSYPAFAAFAAALASVVVFAFSPSLNPIDIVAGRIFEVRVPQVVGLTQTDALVKLSAARLEGEVVFDYSSEVGRGLVMAQDPGATSTAHRDSTVEITVSRGPSRVTLTDFTGRPEADVTDGARTHRTSRPRFSGSTTSSSRRAPSSPRTRVRASSCSGDRRCRWWRASGPVTREVPDVTSLSVEGASFLLGKARLHPRRGRLREQCAGAEGRGRGDRPAAGTSWPRDAPLIMRISSGGPPVAVPDCATLSQVEASKRLGDLHLVVGEISEIGSVRDPNDGKVLDQVPVPGTRLRPGDLVTLTVRPRRRRRHRATVPPRRSAVTTTDRSPPAVPDPACHHRRGWLTWTQ